jgi:hypothetical protein
MAAIIKRRITPLEAALTRLTTGHGSQRLPTALRSVEVINVPSRGGRKGQRAFLKTVLPRVKYHNSDLEITTVWKKMPDRQKKRGNKDTEPAPVKSTEEASGPIKKAVIRLNFGE